MIDVNLLISQRDEVLRSYRERLFDEEAATHAVELHDLVLERRKVVAQADELKKQRNEQSAAIGREKDPAKRAELIQQTEGQREQIAAIDAQATELEQKIRELSLQLPNLPDPSVPVGKSDAENRVLREVGEKRPLGFAAKPHWDLGEALGIFDFERGVKVSGTRFYLLKG